MATVEISKQKLLKFEAAWCGPCHMMSPVLEALGTERVDLPIEKVNVDEDVELKKKYGVKSIPTIILVDENGEELRRAVGFKTLSELRSELEV